MQNNPFSFLKETQNYPYARIRRSYLSERLSDTWHVMAGLISHKSLETWTDSSSMRHYSSYIGVDSHIIQSLGLVDYISLGIFPLLHVVLKTCNAYINNTFLSWPLTLIRIAINCIRYLTALALTLLVFPLVLIIHGTLVLIDPPSFRQENGDGDYIGSQFDIGDIILVDKMPLTDSPDIIPFALYVEYDKRQSNGEISQAGWYYSKDRFGSIKFQNILRSPIQINSVNNTDSDVELKNNIITLLNNKIYKLSFKPSKSLEHFVIVSLNNGGATAEFSRSLRLYGCNRLNQHSDGQKLYLASICEDAHGTSPSGNEQSNDINIWKLDSNDKDTMQFIKTLIEYNVLGITSALEDNNQYPCLQEHFEKIGLSAPVAQNRI